MIYMPLATSRAELLAGRSWRHHAAAGPCGAGPRGPHGGRLEPRQRGHKVGARMVVVMMVVVVMVVVVEAVPRLQRL